MNIIDKLLKTPCYIMDFLPKQVPMNCGGQFFEVETYLLNHYDCCGFVRLTINALVFSDFVLIPVQAAYLPVKGLQQLIKTISMVKKRLNRKFTIEGILLTMVDFRTNYAKDIAALVQETYGSQIAIFKM